MVDPSPPRSSIDPEDPVEERSEIVTLISEIMSERGLMILLILQMLLSSYSARKVESELSSP